MTLHVCVEFRFCFRTETGTKQFEAEMVSGKLKEEFSMSWMHRYR